MKHVVRAVFSFVLAAGMMFGQAAFEVSGTPIPAGLLKQNFGSIPKGIAGFDLNICNVTEARQSIVSSRIFQALSQSNTLLQPVGREIMLAAILRNQNRSAVNILSVVLNSAAGVLSALGASKYHVPTGVLAASAFGSLVGQQVLTNLKPVLSADQLERFESQVLEPALVLDGGSCVERTVFVASGDSKAKTQALSFHVR